MKKKAFTLAEAVMTLGIVGLVASLMIPLVNKFKPDINKVVYLKNYDALTTALDYIVNSKTIYPNYNPNETRTAYKNIVYKNYPLYNSIAVNEDGISLTSGANKFCQIIAEALGSGTVPQSCDKNIEGNSASFTTRSGVDYIVHTEIKDPSNAKGYFKANILIDIDGLSKGNNQTYDTNSKDPDRFEFVVYSGGQVYALDKKGLNYLTQRSTYRKTNEDIPKTMIAYKTEQDLVDAKLYDIVLEYQENEINDEGVEEVVVEEEPGGHEPVYTLPPGHAWADWVTPGRLRTTFTSGIYCEQHNPNMPPGNYSNLRHVYYHQEAKRWVELVGVYSTSSGDYTGYQKYTGPDADKIYVWGT